MTHEDTGKYAAKHPPGITLNEKIAESIREKSSNGGLACATGEKISKGLGVEMPEVGITADLLEIKINKCQLGLFGYGNKPDHGKDIQADDSVPDEMKRALEEASENGEVTCETLWIHSKKDIVADFQLSRKLFDAIPAGNKHFIEYQKSNHIILYDYEGMDAISRITSFLNGTFD